MKKRSSEEYFSFDVNYSRDFLKKVLSISEIATRISTKLTSVMILCIDILTTIFPISKVMP